MFGTFAHPTPLQLVLWAAWGIAQWRTAPPVTWIRAADMVVPATSAVEPNVFEPP